MKRRLRRIVSWLCVLSLCLSLLPGTAWAAGEEDSPVGPDESVTLTVGDTITPEWSPNADSDNQETWGSDNETVAKVDEEGIITAVAEGTTTITHTYYEEKEEVAEPAAPVEGDDEPDSKSNAETSFAESDAEHVEEPVEDLNGDAGDTTVNSAGEVELTEESAERGNVDADAAESSDDTLEDEPETDDATTLEYEQKTETVIVTVEAPVQYVARIVGTDGIKQYETLDEAVEAAEEGATIELLQDCELTQGFNKTLTFTGNGKITINKQLTSNGEGWMCFGLYDPSRVLTFDGPGVEVEWNSEVGTAPWLMLSLSGTLTVTNGAKVSFTVDSGSTGSRNAIYMNAGSTINVSNGSTFEIYGNETAGKEGQGIQLDKTGTATINVTGGSTFLIDGTNRGYVNSPTIYVEDSTFTVQNCTANASNGGKFTAVDSTVTYANNAGHGLSAGSVTLRNSTFTADNNGYYGVYASSAFLVDSTSTLTVTRNSGNGDFAGLKLTSGVTDGKVEDGATVTITDNYCSGLSNNGKVVFEEGVELTITGNVNDKGSTSNGGGVYNSGASADLILPSDAVIYNNHADTAGDDIYSTGTITFGEVGTNWYLDGDEDGEGCSDLITGWFDDSANSRWEAHSAPTHAEEVRVGDYPASVPLALKAAHGVVPLEPDDIPKGTWEKSKSKTAKNLEKQEDGTYTSEVTLSLPAADYERTMDVVFVIDDTYAGSGIFYDSVKSLLDELAAKDTLDVNVGVVAFDAVARDWLEVTSSGTYEGLVSIKNSEQLEALYTAIQTELSSNGTGAAKRLGGSNTEWPVDMATEMLESGTGEDKYLIMFSDMYGYVYRGNLQVTDGTTWEDVPLSKRLGNYSQGQLCISAPMYDTWDEVYSGRGNDNPTYDSFFRDSSWDAYWEEYVGLSTAPEMKEPSNAPQYEEGLIPHIYFTPFEKSICLTYNNITDAVASDIQIVIVNNDFNPGDHGETIQGIKNGMLESLVDSNYITLYQVKTANAEEAISEDATKDIFSGIREDLIQLVDAGSYVVDEIGYGEDNHNNIYNFKATPHNC